MTFTLAFIELLTDGPIKAQTILCLLSAFGDCDWSWRCWNLTQDLEWVGMSLSPFFLSDPIVFPNTPN